MRTKWIGAGMLLLAWLLPGIAAASFHLYQINQLYSNSDGSVQYVMLRESSGANGENFLAGHTLKATSGGSTKSLTFPSNLPSSQTANTYVLIATQGFANLNIVTPDYIMPAGFLPTSGGDSTHRRIPPGRTFMCGSTLRSRS